jgi:hypothetical protein
MLVSYKCLIKTSIIKRIALIDGESPLAYRVAREKG